MNANVMRMVKDFESGPIPPFYAKVIDVGPEGETMGLEVMPTNVAAERWRVDCPHFGLDGSRAIVVVHPHGVTIIKFNEYGAASETITLE